MLYLVEDDPDNAELVKDLIGENFSLRVFRSGAELLRAMDQGAPNPEVFLLDLGLPQMDGFQLLKALRARSAVASIPAIAVTAHAMTGDAERAQTAGFDGYVTKPLIDETMLLAEIHRVRACKQK